MVCTAAVCVCLQSKRMHSACLWLGIVGLCIMVLLMGRRVKGSIMIGILFVTFVSWIPYHKATYFGEASQIKGRALRYCLPRACLQWRPRGFVCN
jgi:AGZA family xanthine/uracil permease-like MFS transporter